MTDTDQLLINRFNELAKRAFSRGLFVYSDFLNIAEQDTLCRMVFDKISAPFTLNGAYPAAERKIACFGDEKLCGYTEEPPISCIKISPISQKFADELSRRDFLGSLMNLGLRREVFGDIMLFDNCAYVFCLESVSEFIAENLLRVKHTSVSCILTKAPELITELPELQKLNVASERLDALVASVYRLSRSESQALITQGKVFINSRLKENLSLSLEPGSIVSVRGLGRFIYEGIERETKKGRLMVLVRIF